MRMWCFPRRHAARYERAPLNLPQLLKVPGTYLLAREFNHAVHSARTVCSNCRLVRLPALAQAMLPNALQWKMRPWLKHAAQGRNPNHKGALTGPVQSALLVLGQLRAVSGGAVVGTALPVGPRRSGARRLHARHPGLRLQHSALGTLALTAAPC